MGAIFGGSRPQLPPPPPPVPQADDKEVLEAREKARLATLRRRGRMATILTNRPGGLGSAPVERPELSNRLGGGDR